MQAKFGYALRMIVKLVIIILLLGLGVNYGLLTPKGNNGLEFSGIFGDSSDLIVVITLSLYVGYRLILNTLNIVKRFNVYNNNNLNTVSLSQKKLPRFSFVRLALIESMFALITVAPIIIGIYWSKANFLVTDLPFLISRIFSQLCIVASCGVIYMELTYPQ
ncbi:MAG: hypothetical protein C4583_00380 [Anaerolineaceae bacterium]|nr:MAG: hypothetical protein C4583_00380 [Anaerolineaceae bacterium]